MFKFLIKAVLAQRLMVMLGTVTLALAGAVRVESPPHRRISGCHQHTGDDPDQGQRIGGH